MNSLRYHGIQEGYHLLETFALGHTLTQRITTSAEAERQATEQARLIVGDLDAPGILEDPEANLAAVKAFATNRDCHATQGRLASLQEQVGRQILHRGVICESVVRSSAACDRPVTVYPRYPLDKQEPLGGPDQPVRRHRAVGSIIGLDLAASELIVRPPLLSWRGICRDTFRVRMVDATGRAMVRVELSAAKNAQRSWLPLRLRQLARATR